MNAPESLIGQMLIAMPTLGDPNFRRSVVLLGAHSPEDGAFGLVVNRPIDVEMPEILDELGLERSPHELPRVLAGGPVQPSHGFVLFRRDEMVTNEDDMLLPDGVTVSGSTATLAALAGSGGEKFFLVLGYSGWFPGQLENEIEENSWLVAPLDTEILFDVPLEDRWVAALSSIGVDPGTLVDTGSATPA